MRPMNQARAVALATTVLLAGCGSSAPSAPTASTTTTAQTTPATEQAASNKPSFIVQALTKDGDQVKVEGHFGPPVPASESGVEAAALSGCSSQAGDGRAIVVQLNLTTTLESSLAGEVSLEVAHVNAGGIVNFVMDFNEGERCEAGEANEAIATLGTLQPGQPHPFSLWVVLPDAITPEEPHPSEATLGPKLWLMTPVEPSVDGSQYLADQHNSVTGSRLVTCKQPDEAGYDYLAVVGDTPSTITESECPVS